MIIRKGASVWAYDEEDQLITRAGHAYHTSAREWVMPAAAYIHVLPNDSEFYEIVLSIPMNGVKSLVLRKSDVID